MNRPSNSMGLLTLALVVCTSSLISAQTLPSHRELALDIFRELIEINTVTATGDTARAAEAMARRLRSAGFSGSDIQAFTPAPRKGNLVARLRGNGTRRPILLLAHLDVVEALRDDWSLDPFKLVEKDGYFYGRGTRDDKFMAAAFVANLIRYKREDYIPDRDIILVLETDEEILDVNSVGIQWLLKNHRDLIDAEFAINEGGNVGTRQGKPLRNDIQTSEKVSVNYLLEMKNAGGHSSLPTKENAIYRLAEGLARLATFEFPVVLNETTRVWLEQAAALERPQIGAAMKAVASARPDPEAVARLSAIPFYNAQLRTTCVATMLEAGHASNALPQTARATVNCRVLPGQPIEEVQGTLTRVVADAQISIAPTGTHVTSEPSPLSPEILRTVERVTAEMWPGIPVIPMMLGRGDETLDVRGREAGRGGRILDHRVSDRRHQGRRSNMAEVKIFHDREGQTLTVWFTDPSLEHVSEETGDEVVLMKDRSGRVIGFEKLNFLVPESDSVHVALETAPA